MITLYNQCVQSILQNATIFNDPVPNFNRVAKIACVINNNWYKRFNSETDEPDKQLSSVNSLYIKNICKAWCICRKENNYSASLRQPLQQIPKKVVKDIILERNKIVNILHNIVHNVFTCSCPYEGFNNMCLLEDHHYYCMACADPLNDNIKFGECGCVYHDKCIERLEGKCNVCTVLVNRTQTPTLFSPRVKRTWIPLDDDIQFFLNSERKVYAKQKLEEEPEKYKYYVYDNWRPENTKP